MESEFQSEPWIVKIGDEYMPFQRFQPLVFALAALLISGFPSFAQQSDIASLTAAAKSGDANAQNDLGYRYLDGQGVQKNARQAYQLFLMAARQNVPSAQAGLGFCLCNGVGVRKNEVEGSKWLLKAAEQNQPSAQTNLGYNYMNGFGVRKDAVQAYKWNALAAAQGIELAQKNIGLLEHEMSRRDIARAQDLARQFNPAEPSAQSATSSEPVPHSNMGTAFFVTDDGFAVTALHVVEHNEIIQLLVGGHRFSARIIKTDVPNDLALLKAEGEFAALPVASSDDVKLGDPVSTIGFPLPEFEGTAPKFSRGEIDALSGRETDDERYFQMSTPIGPGNSGGALMDQRGNVIGVVTGTLTTAAVLKTHGVVPQNVNYATKSSLLRKLLESATEVSGKLKEPYTDETKPVDQIDRLQKATAYVIVINR